MRHFYRLFLLLLILFSMHCKAQIGRRYVPWYYAGIKLNPNMYVYKFDLYGKNSPHKLIPGVNYNVGGLYGIIGNELWEFRMGAQYSVKDFKIDYNYLVPAEEMKYTPDVVEWKLRHLAFPLSVNHNFLGGYVVNFFVSAGIMPEIRFYYNEYTTYMTGNKVESSHLWTSSEFRALAFSTSGSLGMRINFAEKWGLEIEPSCRYYVASLHPDFLRRPLCFTVGTGFYYFW